MKRKTSNLATLLVLGGFLLGIHEGKVTLWRDGIAHPEQVFSSGLIPCPRRTGSGWPGGSGSRVPRSCGRSLKIIWTDFSQNGA